MRIVVSAAGKRAWQATKYGANNRAIWRRCYLLDTANVVTGEGVKHLTARITVARVS